MLKMVAWILYLLVLSGLTYLLYNALGANLLTLLLGAVIWILGGVLAVLLVARRKRSI